MLGLRSLIKQPHNWIFLTHSDRKNIQLNWQMAIRLPIWTISVFRHGLTFQPLIGLPSDRRPPFTSTVPPRPPPPALFFLPIPPPTVVHTPPKRLPSRPCFPLLLAEAAEMGTFFSIRTTTAGINCCNDIHWLPHPIFPQIQTLRIINTLRIWRLG